MAAGIGVSVDVRALAEIGKTLHTVAAVAHAQLPAAVRKSAEPMAAAVKRSAASFSSRIPGSIRIEPAPGRGGGPAVRIVADASVAPHAAPINNRDVSGTFTHPVFDRGGIAHQQAHPFFHTSADAKSAAAEQVMSQRVLDEAARRAGFH